MAPKLYKMDLSPPARAVYLTAKALGLELEYIETSLITKDNLKSEYVKKNPQQTIPMLEDDGAIIWDSHAINAYLVTKYGKDDSLYPKDPIKRAAVDQRLHFDSGVIFSLLLSTARPIRLGRTKTIPEDKIEEAHQAYEFLNRFLEGSKWLAGDDITIADFSALATTTTLDFLVPIDQSKYPNVVAWIKRAEELPYYEANRKGLGDFKELFKKLLSA